ncbi:MAG TPA: succinate dehydrogenase iron-sulfur subunit [Planctomycetota bacterium]|nr:succinate dehydrogenase iron-sulfur subunit [Planctomycetota bacterium]
MPATIAKTFRVLRYDPAKQTKPTYQEFTLQCDPMERILTALNRIKWEQDGSLSYRRSCGHAICGSCGMTIQGASRLACRTLVKDIAAPVITVEPLKGFAVIKDLVVDMDQFYHNLRAVVPYFVNHSPKPAKERRQSPTEQERIDDPVKCILCGCCTSACPSYWKNNSYLGPAALLKAWRFVADTRDEAAAERLDVVNGATGVWRCHTIFNCMEACPKDIDIVAALSQLKRAAATGHA